jgi:hypothetical protein
MWSLVGIYRFKRVPVISSIEPNDHRAPRGGGRLALVRQKGRGSALPCTPRTFRG